MKGFESLSPAPSHEDSENQASRRRFLLKERDAYRNNASELQKGVAEAQTAKLELALFVLMERTDNNPVLINSINAFLDGLRKQASVGETEPGRPLGKTTTQELIEFFRSKAEFFEFEIYGKGRDFNQATREQWRKDKGLI